MRISADTAIRTITAAAGLQPARISAEASVPDVPNVAAETTARIRPVPAGPGRASRLEAIRVLCLPAIATAGLPSRYAGVPLRR